MLFLIIVSGFLVEGVRISASTDEWKLLSPVGYSLSVFLGELEPGNALILHKILWWIHALLVFGWIASLPYTKFIHLLFLPANAFFSKMKPAGELDRIDIDKLMADENFDVETFCLGIQTTGDFTWKQRMDFDACISCGRCEEVCPSALAGQPLSPRKLISEMKNLVRRSEQKNSESDAPLEIIGQAFDQEYQWNCRTCMACTQVCPAFITHVDTLLEIRRNEVVMKGEIPTEPGQALKRMQTLGNPFGSQSDRINWVESLGVNILEPGESCDVLYWIGCLTTFDPTKRKIAEDLISILKQTNVDYAVLGNGELCCGDPARALGDEHTFQTIAKKQIAELKTRRFKTILTSCPHCYNVLKNEYPQFDGQFKLKHHSQFIADLIESSELELRDNGRQAITFHDPCYLGRYQEIYDPPRKVVAQTGHTVLLEMKNNREKSLCCGAGGGHFWMDFKNGERINDLRVLQARDAGAETIVTGCPFCFQMLNDGLKTTNLDEVIQVEDITGLVTRGIEKAG
ncbi:MAG: (Fe-S)-binding protein [Deltaproteobacteria bacterium]|nr:(Fe-S)-binding protein [Deltaproteobacteria bacterium]